MLPGQPARQPCPGPRRAPPRGVGQRVGPSGLQAFACGMVLSVSCSGEEARRGQPGGGGRADGPVPVTVAPSSDWARTGRVSALPQNLFHICNERMPFRFFYIGLPRWVLSFSKRVSVLFETSGDCHPREHVAWPRGQGLGAADSPAQPSWPFTQLRRGFSQHSEIAFKTGQ